MRWLRPFKLAFRDLKLSEFRKQRTEFYLQLAKSIERRERFRTFLIEELRISRAPSTRDDSRAYAVELMMNKLSQGQEFRFSQILGEVMPEGDRLMLSAVDFSKDRPATLRSLVIAISEQQQAKALITKALIPPLVLLPGVFIFSYVLATQSIPVIVKVAPPSVWTPFNQAVRVVSETLGNHGLLMLMVGILMITLFAYQLPRWFGPIRSRLENTPRHLAILLFPVFPILLPLVIYRDFQVTQLLTSLAVLLRGGATLTGALESLRQEAQPWLRWHLRKVNRHLYVSPTEYVEAFSKGLLSARLLARLATTIRNDSRFDRVLIEMGTLGVEEVRKEIASTAKSLNTMLMVGAGAFVIFLYVGQLSIAQSMTDALDPMTKMRESVK